MMNSDSMVGLVVVAVALECWFYFIKCLVLSHKNRNAEAEVVEKTKYCTTVMGVMSVLLTIPSVLAIIYVFRG